MVDRIKYLDNLSYAFSKRHKRLYTRGINSRFQSLNNIYLYTADIIDKFKLGKLIKLKPSKVVRRVQDIKLFPGYSESFLVGGKELKKDTVIDQMYYIVWRKIIDKVIEGNIVLLNGSGSSYVCVEYLSKELVLELYKDSITPNIINFISTKGRYPVIVVRTNSLSTRAGFKRQYLVQLDSIYLDKLYKNLENGFEYPKMVVL